MAFNKNMDLDQLLNIIDGHFMGAKVEEDQAPMTAYMKDRFKFYGVKAPARKEILKKVKSQIRTLDLDSIFTLAEQLWNHPKRESQYLAVDLLTYKKKHWPVEYLPRIEKLIISKSWWDTVDGLAPNIAGLIFYRHPDVKLDWIENWNNSDNMWLNRSAIIHQLRYKSEVDIDLLFALVESHKDSKEFFINKATGWALREASKKYPNQIRTFLNERTDLSNLTVKEASRYI